MSKVRLIFNSISPNFIHDNLYIRSTFVARKRGKRGFFSSPEVHKINVFFNLTFSFRLLGFSSWEFYLKIADSLPSLLPS